MELQCGQGYEINIPDNATPQSETKEIDVRELSRQRRHPMIVAAYEDLAVGESFIVVNDHKLRA